MDPLDVVWRAQRLDAVRSLVHFAVVDVLGAVLDDWDDGRFGGALGRPGAGWASCERVLAEVCAQLHGRSDPGAGAVWSACAGGVATLAFHRLSPDGDGREFDAWCATVATQARRTCALAGPLLAGTPLGLRAALVVRGVDVERSGRACEAATGTRGTP